MTHTTTAYGLNDHKITYTHSFPKEFFNRWYILQQQMFNYEHKTLKTILFDKRTYCSKTQFGRGQISR
jgi:hypothetical protein